jgi:hypothetical protein
MSFVDLTERLKEAFEEASMSLQQDRKLYLIEGVYFIPRLATNTVSIGQLDEVDYKIDINTGVMKIREPRGLLLARVKCEVNRLYLLYIKLA